ncbi:tRNA1(Val) (adenine(37)-N6)-methyltransferase [Succinimonas amylolytica]|uniref:tRNA1(Val) (adenine(37)-N6)-methyltransferase n=1 Tax=Succinimonas amylolytica TaxID=83769 RepID=UPI000381EA16|nr:methyltransferase [Succinimonas amylolytica]
MSVKFFSFQSFDLSFDSVGMGLTTDSVLFASWCGYFIPRTRSERILDAGTGTGVLALIMAQRRKGAEITGIDIEPRAVCTAAENFARSPWSSRLQARAEDIRTFDIGSGPRFSIIISNPPYFKKALPLRSAARELARAEQAWSAEAFWLMVERVLEPEGWVSVVIPPERLPEYRNAARSSGFSVLRSTLVSSFPCRTPYIGFYLFGRERNDYSGIFPGGNIRIGEGPDFQDGFSIREVPGQYSAYYFKLTGDLYLFGREPVFYRQ